MFDWLIVGAGFTGATLAERIATQLDQRVLLIDRRNHVGGNAYDYHDENGVLVHKYGPHIFHTNSEKVWEYLSRFTRWRPYYHKVLAVVDGQEVPLPFNLNSLYRVFPPGLASQLETTLIEKYGYGKKIPILKLREDGSGLLQFLADFVYEKVFLGYTKKQWELLPEELSPHVTARVPVYISRDDRYFQDAFQGMPALGYTELFNRMLSHGNIQVMLNADYKSIKNLIPHKRLIYTGQLDELFDYKYGELPYRSLRFEKQAHDVENYQAAGTVNFPCEFEFTRITEQKLLTGQQTRGTTIIVEYPQPYVQGMNEPYYPIPRDENRKQYAHYAEELTATDGAVLAAGRLADYKYYNMDQAVASALKLFQSEVRNA